MYYLEGAEVDGVQPNGMLLAMFHHRGHEIPATFLIVGVTIRCRHGTGQGHHWFHTGVLFVHFEQRRVGWC